MFDFFAVPRAAGNPLQHIVKSQTELFDFIDQNNGKAPVFISHNSYPTMLNNEPYQIDVSKLFFDFDSDRKPENAQLDVLKLMDWCEKEKIPYLPVFSGSKGFHCYVALTPKTYLYGKFLKDATKAIHLWIKKELGLRTIDLKCAEPRRLCRVMYTLHAKRDKKIGQTLVSGLYCCPLKPEWARTWHMDQIMEYAKHPIEIDYQPSGNLITIEDFLTRFNINIEEMLKSEVDVGGNIKRNSITRYVPVKDEFMKEIIPQPCIQSAMSSQNPPHLARFATVAWLNEIGFDKKWIFDFFYERNYIDRDASVIAYQINNIVAKGYKFPKCKNLFEEGLCVGDVCPNYNNLVRRMKTNDEKSKQCGDAGMHESAKAAC